MLFPATNGRRFTSRHYKVYNWIEYSVSKDEIFCFPCRHFSANIIASGKTAGNLCFVNYGSKCKNWKEQTLSLNNHQRCKTHVICVQRWNDYLLVQKKHSLSIANQVNNIRQQNIIENREHLKFLLKAALFLSKQGLAFRGHNESDTSKNKGNFLEILDMFADDKIKLRLQARYGHYTSPEYQNDFISSIAQCTRQIILNSMNKFGVYTIMVDETKDLSKKEQMSFLIRFVDKELNICERSIGCYHMENSNAESLASEIIKVLSINKLDIMNCIGQCYDGASVMSGQYSGVQERIRSKVPHAIYVHCYAHRLNLCLLQTLQNIPHLCNFFNTIQNLYKFLMNGQTRYELFVRAQKDKQIPVIHLERLVETRWAYWYKSIQKVNMRFTEILEILSILSHQGDQTARAIGILNEISNISFIKTSHAMEILLQTIHCASVELQDASIIQSSAVNLLQNTKQNIQKMRSDTFWDKINNSAKLVAEKNEIVYENSSRNRRPVRLNKNLQDYFVQSTIGQGTFENNSNTSIENNLPLTDLKIIFYTAIDRFLNELNHRFSNPSNEIILTFNIFSSSSIDYFNLKSPHLVTFIDHYKHFKINYENLQSEFPSAKNLINHANKDRDDGIHDLYSISKILNQLPNAFQETLKIINILMTLPVTTASNERFFSSLKLVKTHLRLTMGNERLSDLLVIAVESDVSSKINLDDAVDLFSKMKKRRYPLIN
ncbi:hypothetical protein QTP88_026073 [Uroleucon formosanum]